MASNSGAASTFLKTLRDDPATKELMGNLGSYATAKAGQLAAGKIAEKSPMKAGAVEEGTKAQSEGKNPILGAIKGGLKGIFKRRKGGANKRPTNIYEWVAIGVPVRTAYDAWCQYQEWPSYMKGPEKVAQEDDVTTNWTAKVWWSRRQWKGRVVEQKPDERIKWECESAKGTLNGVVTFTDVGNNLTLVVLVVEYRPKGMMEWTANRWRAVGRRIRLDMKHYVRHVTMAGEATGSWRGTIEDGEVVVTHEDATEQEELEQQYADSPDHNGDPDMHPDDKRTHPKGKAEETDDDDVEDPDVESEDAEEGPEDEYDEEEPDEEDEPQEPAPKARKAAQPRSNTRGRSTPSRPAKKAQQPTRRRTAARD